MRQLNLVTAVLMLLLAGLVVGSTWDLTYWSDGSPGPAFLPFWIAGVSALAALLLLIDTLRKNLAEAADWPDKAGTARVITTIVVLIGFAIALPLLGLIVACSLFMLVTLLLIQRRRVIPSLLTSFITVGLVQFVFVTWLHIDMPKGILGF